MSERAWSRDYGARREYTGSETGYTVRRNNDGIITSQDEYQMPVLWHICRRSPHVSGEYTTVYGVPWRRCTDYEQTAVTIKNYPGDYSWTYSIGSFQWREPIEISALKVYMGMGGYWVVDEVIDDPNGMARARTECLLRLNEQKVNLATALAEARQTAIMLADAALNLGRALLDVKHGRWGLIPKRFGIFTNGRGPTPYADRFLEYQFGWKPLMSDIYGLHELLTQRLDRPLIIHATRRIETHQELGSWMTTNPGQCEIKGDLTRFSKVKISAKVKNDYLAAAQQAGLVNPLELAWEIVPWSFVVDWFVPVGNTLRALTATAGLDFVDGSESTLGELSATITQTVNGAGYSGRGGSADISGTSYRRAALHGFPMPEFYAPVKSPFKTNRILDAIALIAQLVK